MGFPAALVTEGEAVVLVVRRHVKALVLPALVLVLGCAAAGVLAGLVPAGGARPWLWGAIAAAAAVLVLRWSVWPFLVWWADVLAVTDRRLLLRSGVLRRRGRDVPLHRVDEIRVESGPLQRVIGTGTLTLDAGDGGPLVLTDVPRVRVVHRTLTRLAEPADLELVDDAPQSGDRT